MSAMRPKEFHFFGWTCLATNYVEIRAHVSLKVATNDSFRDKKNLKIWDYYSKALTKAAASFLEVSAQQVLLKAVTKFSLKNPENLAPWRLFFCERSYFI